MFERLFFGNCYIGADDVANMSVLDGHNAISNPTGHKRKCLGAEPCHLVVRDAGVVFTAITTLVVDQGRSGRCDVTFQLGDVAAWLSRMRDQHCYALSFFGHNAA